MLFDGWLICSDIDGTLLNSEGKIGGRTFERLEYYMSNGGLFTVSTGRFPKFILNHGICPNAPMIVLNGTALYDPIKREYIRCTPFDTYYFDVLEMLCGNTDCLLSLNFYTNCGHTDFERSPYTGKIDLDAACIHANNRSVLKVIVSCIGTENSLRLFNEVNSRFSDRVIATRSSGTGLELTSARAGKGKYIDYLKSMESLHIKKCVAIGDYQNDISMLEAADIGIAPANALDSVKEIADIVTVSNDEDPVADIIDLIEKGRI